MRHFPQILQIPLNLGFEPGSPLKVQQHESAVEWRKPSFYEFFAGGGMARAGLGNAWQCLFANDFDHKKSRTYQQNWGAKELRTQDVGTLKASDLPGTADLAWASFPCQDLSLAGGGAGLQGNRSGTFRPFWKLMQGLVSEHRAPKVVILENVCGAITSHEGRDFETLCSSVEKEGYRVGAFVVNASLFLPQSRPRLFVVGVRNDLNIPQHLFSSSASRVWHPLALRKAYGDLPTSTRNAWIWWNPGTPPSRSTSFRDLMEDVPAGNKWFTEAETQRLLKMMSSLNRAKVEQAASHGLLMVGCVYKRTRPTANGEKVQRAEVRFDDISGCLRTPAGGSSRQVIIVVEAKQIRARLITSRETARLMGLPDNYSLPENYNEAYHLTGDGVAVPVVRHIADQIVEPIIKSSVYSITVAA